MNGFKHLFSMKDTVVLGKKQAPIKKLTPAMWKRLFTQIDLLPGLAMQIISSPRNEMAAYLLHGFDVALEEIVDIISTISGIESDYLMNEAGLDELVEYIYLTVKKNRLDQIPKNLKGLLPTAQPEQTEKAL